jgi:hypothetical protein
MLKADFDKQAAALPDDADAAPVLGTSVGALTIGALRALLDGVRPEDSFALNVDASGLLVFRDGVVISKRKLRETPAVLSSRVFARRSDSPHKAPGMVRGN